MEALTLRVPSLVGATSLTVKGPVKFIPGVTIKGDVTFVNGDNLQGPCDAVLLLACVSCNGELWHFGLLDATRLSAPVAGDVGVSSVCMSAAQGTSLFVCAYLSTAGLQINESSE